MSECEIDVHDLEAQLVCESCGHRECLPAGSVVLSPADAEKVRSFVGPYRDSLAGLVASAYRDPKLQKLLADAESVLALLDGRTT